ncbi:MAG: signal peptide peptidase SppA, partial [Candidatus Latescibacterota bacterium]
VSLGLVGNFATQKDYRSGLADLAVRPLGDRLLTVFADYEFATGMSAADAPWSVGAMLDVGPGLEITGRYFENESFAVSVGYNFNSLGLWGSPRFDDNQDHAETVYQVRAGFPKPNILHDVITEDNSYLSMKLKGTVIYRGYKYFDKNRHRFSEIICDLEHAKNDKRIKGVALNLSGTKISRGKAWELRDKLTELQAAGKHVVIFVDDVGMTEYHLASVADRIVLDPVGIIMLPGYVMGRTFVKDLLEKVGVGFDEWRFFKYKSAAEALSRDSMSEADREQRLAIIEDIYETVRADASDSRNTTPATFDDWVNEEVVIVPKRAIELGLVDKLGRWEDVKDVIKELEGEKKSYVHREGLAGNWYPSTLWGEDPKIAVVYGLGVCAMDTGIKARKLEKIFQRLKDDKSVKGVVFRVDSPGGDGMASDVVAEALRKCAEKKPVIVSQGDVAGSGGYWISMYGTKIYALPTSITGSIGVIGGWVWDTGLGEKLGHTSDHVKVGDHADLGYGIRLLLAGPMLPKRNLTEEERDEVKKLMLGFYGEFVEKVATGRKMRTEEIHEIAQGHVFSGTRGKEIGLVDEIGGLDAAITAARTMAGIDADERVKIVEFPKLPLINLKLGGPSPFGLRMIRVAVECAVEHAAPDEEAELHPEWAYLRALLDKPGQPLYMVPPELFIYDARLGR